MPVVVRIFRCCVSEGVPRRSFIVALFVGTVLNLINQGDVLLAGGPLDVTKLRLTFAAPYCVATCGAVFYRLSVAGRAGAAGQAGNPASAAASQGAQSVLPAALAGPVSSCDQS